MTFEIIKQQFGELTEYVVQDTRNGNRFAVVPELGAVVRQLSLRKGLTLFSILKTPPTPDKLKEDTQSASELLFPFASRIPSGKYHFLGKDYQLHKNEKGGVNAIHGLVRKHHFSLQEQRIQPDNASIKLAYHLSQQEGYPFEVLFSVTYSLNLDGIFSLSYQAHNLGKDACPAMFGWHPYFDLGNEEVDAWKINIPSKTIVTFDDHMIPTGEAPFPHRGAFSLLRNELDNCFVVESEGNTAITELISDNQEVTLEIKQETGEGKFNYLVVYTPPSRDCVAIEPLTANVDAFNNGEGLNIIGPDQQIAGTITLKLR
ncbi:aldose 1-epimerase [Dyadobacter jejuensis]|uniref:Aldose 1-epimerase n=1 Tax=Dyadobacter jejuensis TaxID=1082580 RepID=A0A316AL26_9BACT|nr:aldose 1-epimerase [Dyadobacter jejuensis]PWJ58241.1 aldose 1-epimerase [Dyadobacter jejuensis]